MNAHKEIHETLDRYFKSIYTGDVARLKTTFHPQAVLFGEINGQPYLKPLPEYLHAVENRKSPEELGEAFEMKVVSVEVLDTVNIAYAKTHCRMLGFNYFDFLSLIRQDNRWMIVNKLFAHVPPQAANQ